MENKKNRPAFRGRDAAMLGGIAGGFTGAYFPTDNPQLANKIFEETVLKGDALPQSFENPLAMNFGGKATLAGAGLGALGGAAAYQVLKGLGKGIGKGIKKLSEKKASKDK